LLDAGSHVWPVRLTLDYPEDHALISMIAREHGYMAPRQAIDELFVKNPQLHLINWFRNREWKEWQDNERSHRLRKTLSKHGGD
jgi:hypothetical protein